MRDDGRSGEAPPLPRPGESRPGDEGDRQERWGEREKPVTRAHRLEYAGFVTVAFLSRLLPERLAFGVGESLGWVVGRVLGIRRKVVEENLRRAFPERSAEWRGKVAIASYRHLGREMMSTLRFNSAGGSELLKRTEVSGLEELEEAMAEGKGAVLVAGHTGNWELGGAILAAHGIPLDAVVTRQSNPLVDEEFFRSRSRFGVRVVERRKAPRQLLRSLRSGRAVALVADQNAGSGGVFVDFFGTPASTAKGPALFALRAGAPLFLAVPVVRRSPDDPILYRLGLERIEVERTGDLEEDVRRLTAAHTAKLQHHIEKLPEQYFWHHRRWKTRPEW